jgi:hypothetical protein
MTLDEKFLKYKLEKIKNDDIFRDQDSGTKKRIRKANSKKAKKEANAIHSYLTGIDTVQPWNRNRSFISDEGIPGSLTISGNGKLDVVQVKGRGRGPLSILKSRQLKIFKKIFDSLNIIFKRDRLSIGGNLLVEKDLEIKGNLIVLQGTGRGAKKSTTFQGNHIFDGNLEVKKNTTIRNHLFVSKNTVSENLTVNKNFLANQGVFNQELMVNGKTDINGDTTFRRGVTIGGDLTFGDTTLSPDTTSATPDGYTYLMSGILLQWGTDTRAEDGAFVIDFPTPFPNACFSVTVNRQAGNAADDHKTYAVTATIITTTGFTIDRDDNIHGEDSINWIAIGN